MQGILANVATDMEACWDWPLSVNVKTGYGQYAVAPGNIVGAHRAAYLLFVGHIPDGMLVCHLCDNRRCVNPEHLALGSDADNLRDMTLKGRHAGARRAMPRGAEHWTHRHPERVKRSVDMETAQAIAACPGSFRAVGRLYGISHKAVSAIKAGTYFGSSAGSAEKTRILGRR